MNQRLLDIQQKIDALSQRERVLVFFMAAAALVIFFRFFFIDTLLQENSSHEGNITQLKTEIQQNNAELMVVNAQLTVGVNRVREAKRELLENKLASLNNKIEQSVVAMIPPRMMAQVLENILMQDEKLKLLALENKPVQTVVDRTIENSSSVVKNENEKSPDIVAQGLYKHTFVLKLEGGYSAAVDYFERLESLPWRFYWDDLHYEVVEYPKAVITLEVHTVSMSEDWIGV
jgi:MSHA biogenesis protein MshJ